MAKTRAQRKAEARRREAERARKGEDPAAAASQAQHDTQVPESPATLEVELAEQGADLEALRHAPDESSETELPATDAPAPSRADVGRPEPAEAAEPADKISRRARRAEERERKQRAKESEQRRAPKDAPVERQRGGVAGFIASCWAELKRVQWPDRDTLIQASAITLIFITVMAAYLGILDAIFNFLVQRIL